MSKFYLDIDGTEFGLNREHDIMLMEPTGFGVNFANSFADIVDGFFAKTDKKQSIGQIVGDLIFTDDAYADYESFVNSILTASKLVLIYEPISGSKYRADVEIAYITKSEVRGGMYKAPIAFDLKSLWYTEETLTGTGTVSVTAGGQYETAITATFSAIQVFAPEITLISEADTVALVKVLNHTIHGAFTYSNEPSDSKFEDSNGDLLPYVLTDTNVFARTRKAFTVNISPSTAMTIKVRKYWRTV